MLTSVLCVCVVTNILHEGLHIVSFYLGCCTSNYNLPGTLPPGEGMDFFEALKTSLPNGRLVIFLWRYRTDLAYSVGVMPNLSLN